MTDVTAQKTKRISLRDVLFVLFYKLQVFAGIFFFIVVATLAVAFLKNPVYQVTANILVKPLLEPNLKLQAPVATNIKANPVTPQDINSEVNILSSPQLLREVVTKLELDKEEPPETWAEKLLYYLHKTLRQLLLQAGLTVEVPPAERALIQLQKRLEIKPVTLSNSIEVSFKGDSPAGITRIVNTLLESYVDYHIDIHRVKGARAFYTQQTEIFREKLKQAENDLDQFKQEWSIIQIKAQNEANVALMKMLRENLALTRAQIDERRTKVGVQAKNFSSTGDIGALTKEYQTNLLEELVRVMGPLLAERERISLNYQKTSEKFQSINRQVEEIQKTYKQQIGELLRGAQLDLSGLQTNARFMEQTIKSLEDKSVLLSRKEIELDRLTREVKQNEKNYLLYLDKTEEARIEEQQEANRVSNVTISNWAQPPSVPVFPKKILMTFLAVVVGAVVGIAGAFTAFYLDHSIKTPEDLAWYSQVPTLAAIQLLEGEVHKPALPPKPSAPQEEAPLWMLTPQQYPSLLENYQNLKNNLLLLKRATGAKVFLLTGPQAGAGISATAYNLALVLAYNLLDQRVLLVDTNLFHPSLHRVFGKAAEPGLMDFLLSPETASVLPPSSRLAHPGLSLNFAFTSDPLQFEAVIQNSTLANLHLVTIGRAVPDVLSPFDLNRFAQFIAEARQAYDLVILDGPPVFQASHTLIISARVDGVIVVAEAQKTRYEVLMELKSQVERHGKVVGGVLNKRQFVIPAFLYRHL